MSGKSLFTLAFLVITGTLANAQCPTPTNSRWQRSIGVRSKSTFTWRQTKVHPTCPSTQNWTAATKSRMVREPVSSPTACPTSCNIVANALPNCGSGVSVVMSHSMSNTVTTRTPVAGSAVASTPSKCACTLRDISSNNETNGRAMNSIVERPNAATQGPFSEVGHVRPDSGRAIPNPCEIEFLECCAAGGTNCASNYAACADMTGEKVKHALCPEGGPDPSARKTDSAEQTNNAKPATGSTGGQGVSNP
jgi:hypothetical protein